MIEALPGFWGAEFGAALLQRLGLPLGIPGWNWDKTNSGFTPPTPSITLNKPKITPLFLLLDEVSVWPGLRSLVPLASAAAGARVLGVRGGKERG